MRFGELLEGAGLECPEKIKDVCVSAIVTDSRKVIKNCIFVCCRGAVCDGHGYIEAAIRAGATLIVAEKVRDECVGGAAIILVDNTRHTASLLYNVWFGRPTDFLKIIGVTGTNGKTSVATMMRSIFELNGYRCGFIGTTGCTSADGKAIKGMPAGMTTPSPEFLYSALAEMKNDGVEYVFMEVSSHALAQSRTDAITFDTAVFTNLTEDHLDFHHSMEEYYKTKEKLFTQCRQAVVNADDRAAGRLIRFLKEHNVPFKTSSRDDGDFCALNEKTTENGTQYLLKISDKTRRVNLPLLGDFQIINSLQAAAVASLHGISLENISLALDNVSSVSGRMERFRGHEKQSFEIFIDYAHTPDALEKLLESARRIRKSNQRIILMFGCGGEREREKRRIMGQIASRLADFTILTSDNSRGESTKDIIADILKGIDKEKPYTVIEDRREAIEYAICECARERDILVLAGKGHETYQIDSKGVKPFDEREIAREALVRRYS